MIKKKTVYSRCKLYDVVYPTTKKSNESYYIDIKKIKKQYLKSH